MHQQDTSPRSTADVSTLRPTVMHTILSWQMFDDYVLHGTPVTALCGEHWTPDSIDPAPGETVVDCPLCGLLVDGGNR